MIITQEISSPVISNIAATPTRFKIKASAKAFKILSGFYSEPILAIPRELGANAWDSHVKAGNTDTMFEVHAPNTLEPWFSVRDFGTGLSPEAIDTIYTTYFESTKTTDNDSDGCMGLGSKTPFNYTDNFNVTSWYKGKKHVYNCFIDEQGSPNIMHVVTEDSSEHTGLEVKFGVKISDISMWVDKITRAYEPFRYRPNIKGANIQYKPRQYIYSGKGWSMRKNDDSYYNRGCNAFMGNYCYPISSNALRNAIYKNSDAYKLETALNYGNFDFFFDIGQLEVAPNKEQLQYEDANATTVAIVAALKVAIGELKAMVDASIVKPSTRWEAMYLYNKYNGYNSQYAHVRNIIGNIAIQLNGSIIQTGTESVITVHKHFRLIDPVTGACTSPFSVFVLDTPNGRFKRTGNYTTYSENRGVEFFYTNQPSIKSARLRHHLRTKYTTGVFPVCYVIVDQSKKNETFTSHMQYFGWDKKNITEIESLPKPPKVPRQKKIAGTDEIFYTDIGEFIKPAKQYSTGGMPRIWWQKKADTFDSTGTYYYVDFYYSDPVWKSGKNVDSFMARCAKIFVDKKLNNGVSTIYGINVKNKHLLKTGKWINVFDVVKVAVNAEAAIHEQNLYAMSQRVHFDKLDSVYSKLTRSPSIVTNIKKESTRTMFQTFIKSYKETQKMDTDGMMFLELFDLKAKKHVESEFDPEKLNKLLKEKYLGVFDLIDTYSYTVHPIYNIINFIDEKC